MKFKDLSDATGLPVRELRYLMAIGIVPPGKGRGRFADAFDDTHVAAVDRYRAFSAIGLTAREIGDLPPGAIPPTIVIRTMALELRILPGASASDLAPAAIETFLQQAEAALTACREGLAPLRRRPEPARASIRDAVPSQEGPTQEEGPTREEDLTRDEDPTRE